MRTKAIILFLLLTWQSSLTSGLLMDSQLKPVGGGSSCKRLREYFQLITKTMHRANKAVIQYGVDGNSRPMFRVSRTRNEIIEGMYSYSLPDSVYDPLFLACFSNAILNPDNHDEAFERIEKVETCLGEVKCEIELPEVPGWLQTLMVDLDSDKLATRQKATTELYSRCSELRSADEADLLSLQLVAGQKSQSRKAGVVDALERVLGKCRDQHKTLIAKSGTNHGGGKEAGPVHQKTDAKKMR